MKQVRDEERCFETQFMNHNYYSLRDYLQRGRGCRLSGVLDDLRGRVHHDVHGKRVVLSSAKDRVQQGVNHVMLDVPAVVLSGILK